MSESDPAIPDHPTASPSSPPRLLSAFDELLRQPERFATRDGGATVRRVLLGAFLCLLAYGAAAGAFAGGWQVVVAALKTPAIVFASLLLCLPSLYVFASLAGIEIDRRRFALAVAGLAGLVGLLLAAFLPIAWLFSVSSRSLLFVVSLHLVLWTVALVFGRRFVRQTLGGSGGLTVWFVLLFFVTLQVTTQLRPVLVPGERLVERGKLSFVEHWSDVVRHDLDLRE